MWLLVYGMLVNVNDYYVHVCEQARWARSAGNSAIDNVCFIISNSSSSIMCLVFYTYARWELPTQVFIVVFVWRLSSAN